MAQLREFLRKLIVFTIILIIIGLILYGIQYLFHPFNGLIDYINQDISIANTTLSSQAIGGISLATLIPVLFLLIFPLFHRGVNNKQYFTSFWRSTLATIIFVATEYLYKKMEEFGRFYLFLSVVGVIFGTFILVEIFTKLDKKENEVSVRTDIIAAIVSGLVFGLVVKLATYGLENISKIIKFN
jgi:hypothetical protein